MAKSKLVPLIAPGEPAAPLSPAEKYALAQRWSPQLAAPDMLAATGGYVPVLGSFLQSYAWMSLTSAEAMLVVHLMSFKWTDGAPFPSYNTLATLMGCSPKRVRRYAQRLECLGYLRREIRVGRTNRFHLDGLFRALEEHLATNS